MAKRTSDISKITSAWLAHGDPDRMNPKKRRRPKRLCASGKRGMFAREIRAGKQQVSIRDFVESVRNAKSTECIFVPGSQRDVPAAISFLGKNITAARYMALLTFGTPKYEDMVVRHLCGNGHLSCVNPAHLARGTQGDNISDAGKHRALGEDATMHDKLNAVTPNT